MAQIRLTAGNWYKIREADGTERIGQYYGREEGFECVVCGKGHNAYAFNFWYEGKRQDDGTAFQDYQTWAYGREHLPTILEKVGGIDDLILDIA